MKKKLYSAILASIMVIGSICGVAIPVYAKEETKIIDGNDSYDTATYLDVNGSYSDVLSDSNDVDFYKLIPDSNGKLSINFGHVYGESSHVHMAHPNGRVCGAKRPKCEAERSHHL